MRFDWLDFPLQWLERYIRDSLAKTVSKFPISGTYFDKKFF